MPGSLSQLHWGNHPAEIICRSSSCWCSPACSALDRARCSGRAGGLASIGIFGALILE
jgi:hypothetical protein